VTALLVALAAAYGVHLLYTAVVFRWRGLGPGPQVTPPAPRRDVTRWLREAGVSGVGLPQFAAASLLLLLLGGVLGFAIFGGILAAVALGAFTAMLPAATLRSRRRRRLERAQEAWPTMIDELRILTGSAGLSIPQALFEVGRRAPAELRPAFAAAQREWLLSTDFARTLGVLKRDLADPTCDAACETILVANELGGTGLEARLTALSGDRLQEVQGRKDARARQAGARFARRFVLLVPLGMALAGLSVGTGRAAYATAAGQVAVLIGIGVVAGCWWWAGRIMQVPVEGRVFAE
jgi:tight adherence protein B